MNNIDNIEHLKENNILVIDNFLDTNTCHKILEELSDDKDWIQSKVSMLNGQMEEIDLVSPHRTNTILPDYKFSPELNSKIESITVTLLKTLKIKSNRLENWQLSKYKKGHHFDFHNDCGCWQHHPSGEREKTVLIYLHAPANGGETCFRAINHYVRPLQGRLICWNNLLPNGNCNHAMIHAGLPVKKGIKITMNTWIRQRPFINQ